MINETQLGPIKTPLFFSIFRFAFVFSFEYGMILDWINWHANISFGSGRDSTKFSDEIY